MPAAQTGVLYVKFKPDSVFTVSRERVDEIAQHFQQDATFVTHFALARLYDDIQNGKYKEPSSIPLAERWLTTKEVADVKAQQTARLGKRKFKSSGSFVDMFGGGA
jgi:beta-galactosidase GanA